MEAETAATEESVRLGISREPFTLLVGMFAAMGVSLGVAGFLIGYSGHGQLARQPLMNLMLGIVPFIGIIGVSLVGPVIARDIKSVSTATVTVALGGALGHLLVFGFVFGFLFVLPWNPDMNELDVIDVMFRGTAGTVIAGGLVGALTARIHR